MTRIDNHYLIISLVVAAVQWQIIITQHNSQTNVIAIQRQLKSSKTINRLVLTYSELKKIMRWKDLGQAFFLKDMGVLLKMTMKKQDSFW